LQHNKRMQSDFGKLRLPQPLMRSVSMQVKFHRWITAATFVICVFTCLAYEAIRINGWYNRFEPSGWDSPLSEVAFYDWNPIALSVYILIFMAFVVVASNKYNPKIKFGTFLFAIAMLVILCANIPDAWRGRWNSTSQEFLLFYYIFVSIPSIILVVIGLRSMHANKRMQSDPAELGR